MNPLADRRWLARSLVAAVILAWTVAGPVLGHADLVSSDPKNGAVLATPPPVITLTFSEALDATKSSFKVIGPAGSVGTGKVAGDPSGMTLANLALTPGDYEIQWTSVAVDGHIARGILTFTVSEPTPAPATPTPAPSATEASSAEPSVAATPAPTPPPTPAPSAAPTTPASSSGDVLLPIVVALALVAGAGAYLLRRSRRA